MPLTTIAHHEIHVDDEGFMTAPAEWSEPLAESLAAAIGITLTDEHLLVIREARADYAVAEEAPTLRRLSSLTGLPIKRLFELFPSKPAKKVAYVAGLPKPRGCV